MALRQIDKTQALVRLERLCAKSERCSWELSQKLCAWNISAADAEDVIESLRQRRYLDDKRFARAFARDRARFSGWGRLKIAAELRLRKIPADYIREAIVSIDEEQYHEKLRHFISAKIQAAQNEQEGAISYETRAKIYRAAIARGYEPAIVAELLRPFSKS